MTTSTLQRNLDYTDRDFASLRFRLQDLIQGVYSNWTDFNEATFGNILLEMMAHVGDVIGFYQDNQAAECFLGTMSQRISAIRLARLLNYTIQGAASATGTVTFSLASAHTRAIPIPVGTVVRTDDPEDPVYFRTTALQTVAIGELTKDVAVEQAEAHLQLFQADGTPNQRVPLDYTPFLDSSATVTVAGAPYTEQTTILGSTSTSKVIVVSVDQEDRGYIQFGNGVNGEIPSGEISVSYKTGGGVAGNVEADMINVMDVTLVDDLNANVYLEVTNAAACSGGTDRMGIEEVRAQLPASLRTLTRTVSKQDFEDAGQSVSGVARALMLTSNEGSSIAENSGIMYVVARGTTLASGRIAPAAPSTTLLTNIETYINTSKPPMLTFTWEARAAVFKDINIAARVYLEQGVNSTTVGNAIRTNLADFFAAQLSAGVANPDIDFGANLKNAAGTIVAEVVWSDVFNVIRDTTGVRKVSESTTGLLLNTLRQSVVMQNKQFPRLGTTSIVDVDTGATI